MSLEHVKQGFRARRGRAGWGFIATVAACACLHGMANRVASADPIAEALQEMAQQPVPIAPPPYRSYDGRGNNEEHDDWGAAGIEMLRTTRIEYADGFSQPAGQFRPSARIASNHLCDQEDSVPNTRCASDYIWQWGQWIDHDMDETPVHDRDDFPHEIFDIIVPLGDPFFDSNGTQVIPLTRSVFAPSPIFVPRQQINAITSYIDGSGVYGSSEERAHYLRSGDGRGIFMRTSGQGLLPYNCTDENGNEIECIENAQPAGFDPSLFFIAGDVRSNEQNALTAMHTLFVNEHNRLAALIDQLYPTFSDEQVFQFARHLVGAEIEAITFNEWLPALMGPHAPGPYDGYNREADASVANFFAHASFRFGHSMLSPQLLRLGPRNRPIPEGPLPLAEAFFRPDLIEAYGVQVFFRGLARQRAQRLDVLIVDGVRNFLFGPPGAGGFDLASLNMQRGRDHGLANYNQARRDYGLPPVASFDEITQNAAVRAQLQAVYGNVENIDPWVGGLAEDPLTGAHVGPLVHAVLVDQFKRVRAGDRFWYQNYFTGPLLDALNQIRLSDIIRANYPQVGNDIQNNVFRVPLCPYVDPAEPAEEPTQA